MKYLLVLAIALLVFWVWRSARGARKADEAQSPPPASQRKSPPALPQDMVPCTLCAMHVPRAEATEGRKGLYCGAEHLQLAEG